MADCPLVERKRSSGSSRPANPLALVPSEDGGVNALALRPLDGFRPRFGVPVETMIASARGTGSSRRCSDDARLAFDVDRPGDLALL